MSELPFNQNLNIEGNVENSVVIVGDSNCAYSLKDSIPLSNKKLTILRKIKKGTTTTTQIAEELGEDLPVVDHLMEELKAEGYIDGERAWPPMSSSPNKEFVNSKLTNKGRSTLISVSAT